MEREKSFFFNFICLMPISFRHWASFPLANDALTKRVTLTRSRERDLRRIFEWQRVAESAARWLCRANGGVEGTQENRDLLFAATISSAQRELLRRHTEQLVRKKKKTQEIFEGNLSRGRDNSRESVLW